MCSTPQAEESSVGCRLGVGELRTKYKSGWILGECALDGRALSCGSMGRFGWGEGATTLVVGVLLRPFAWETRTCISCSSWLNLMDDASAGEQGSHVATLSIGGESVGRRLVS